MDSMSSDAELEQLETENIPVRRRSEGRSVLTAAEIAMVLMLVWAGLHLI